MAYGVNGFSGGRHLSDSVTTTHAEIDAVRKLYTAKKRIRTKLSLISAAFDGERWKMSKPCLNCCVALKRFGITRVVWCNTEGLWQRTTVHELQKTAVLSSGDSKRMKSAL